MSPRTTLVLVILLAVAAGVAWFVSRNEAPRTAEARRLLAGVTAADVVQVKIAIEGKPDGTVLLRRAGAGDSWTLAETNSGGEMVRPARRRSVESLLDTLREASAVRVIAGASQDEPGRFGLAPGMRRSVTVTMKDGSNRTIWFGADVTDQSVAARVDDRWPPVEVDGQIVREVIKPAGDWLERHLVVVEPTAVRSVRVQSADPGIGSFTVAKESSQWILRAPSLARADQVRCDRLVATLSSLELQDADPASGAPGSRPATPRLVVDVEAIGSESATTMEFGDSDHRGLVAARRKGDATWGFVRPLIVEALGRGAPDFLERTLVTQDSSRIRRVRVLRDGETLIDVGRPGAGPYFFAPPPEWKWPPVHGQVPKLTLDASAQTSFIDSLQRLSVTSVDAAVRVPSPRLTVIVDEAGATEADRLVSHQILIGGDDGGQRAVDVDGGRLTGTLKSSATDFLERPYFHLLARQANATAWFSILEVSIEEPGRRTVTMKAMLQPDRTIVWKYKGQEGDWAPLPVEVSDPILTKVSLLTVKSFVSSRAVPEHGLDRPRLIVKWKDTIQQSEVKVNVDAPGQVMTWRVGARDGAGADFGEVDIHPGLVFQTEARDLDPFLNLLNRK